jgi:hypothetical protein
VTLADVFAYAQAEGVTLRMDATEIRVRRPQAGRGGRKAFVSGKARLDTMKTTVVSDATGAILWCGSHRPGRMHDHTAVRVEGIDALLEAHPTVRIPVDAGYQGGQHHGIVAVVRGEGPRRAAGGPPPAVLGVDARG